MADDIDIEEHDVLDNPLIKRIFPDLTILKKEIIDYNNYEHEDSSQNSDVDEWSSTTLAETTAIEENQNTCSSGLIKRTFENKIILGTKHSSNKQKKQNLNVCIKKAKVCLPNIKQILNNNNKFCEVCLILFPSQESLNGHILLAHKNTKKKCISKQNIESNKVKKCHECPKCCVTFSSVSNLYRHERNIHSRSKKNRNEDDDNNITDVNVGVEINDPKSKSLVKNHLKKCFHCDKMFATQQLLIDHLYEVLNSKKSQMISNKTSPGDNQQINITNEQTTQVRKKDGQENMKIVEQEHQDIKDDSIEDSDKIYVCPEDNQQINKTNEQTTKVTKKDGQENMKIVEQEHKDIENDSIEDSDMIYVCPICSYCFNVWDFYEAHMKRKHSVNKVKATNKVAYEPKCKFCDLHYSTYKSYNTHLHKAHKSKILQKVQMQSCNNVKKMTTKENRKLIVQRKQQLKQKIVHGSKKNLFENKFKHQRKYNESNFIKNDVKVMALKTILFKCAQCNIHFMTTESAKSHKNHNLLENSRCINCKKYFKEKDMNLHLEQHKYSNHFSVINISKKKNIITKIKRYSRTLHKCPSCAVHFGKEHISDHYSVCATEPSQSTYCKICDILIADNIKILHGKDHEVNKLKPSDFKIIDFKKIRNKQIKGKQDSSPKTYEEMYSFNLSYCNVCKCNVSRTHYKSTVHFQSRCSHFIKYVCKFCGLVFSNKSVNTHRKLHQKFSNISLKDFTFYNLKSGEKILPPVPVFPKCNSCEKHFITKFEVKTHVCHSNNHLTCPTCKIKLSNTAYKLHVPFHNLALNYVDKETKMPLILEDVSLNINTAVLSDELQSKRELVTIFTCQNCVVSFNLYDEAINHCHLHTNLDRITIDTVECGKCNLTYDAACYEEHLHLQDFPEGTFRYIQFDVFHFGSPNDRWLKHVFGSMPQDVVHGIVENAIYKYETRVKMRILQNGSSDTTVFKCQKCHCLIHCHAIYKHTKTCNESQNYTCNVCYLPVTSTSSEDHEKCNSNLKSFRIIEFNGKQDEEVNYKIANMRKCYILYECRLCHSVVDKNYEKHVCVVGKECTICGLLLNELDYDIHISKHRRLISFNENFMKVILLGAKPEVNNRFQRYGDILSKFSGIVCDYTFYKCFNCDVCVRDQRNTYQHYCLIDAAKSKCPKCDLVFDEGKLKGHLKLHDTDPEFVKETILVQSFHTRFIALQKIKPENTEQKKESVNGNNVSDVKDQINTNSRIIKIYKCVCGLHYLTEATIKLHTKKCNGKVKTKQSKQNCSKCDLTFSPDVLFKHLIEHHGNKDILFEYEIINLNNKPL